VKSLFTSTQFKILSALLQEAEPRSISHLSKTINIKPRVIQYNLNTVDHWLKNKGIELIRRRGVGIYINLPIDGKQKILQHLSGLLNVEIVLAKQVRLNQLILKTINSEKPVSSSSLIDEFNVSRTTLINDLLVVEKRLSANKLTLKRDRQRGFSIQGNQANKRVVKSWILCSEQMGKKFSMNDSPESILCEIPYRQLSGCYLSNDDVKFLSKTINEIERIINAKFSQSSIIFVFFYLANLLMDIKNDRQIKDFILEEYALFRANALIMFVKSSFALYTGKELFESEIHLILLHCYCLSKFERDENGVGLKIIQGFEDPFSKKLNKLFQYYIKEISLHINPFLYVDEVFHVEAANFFESVSLIKKYSFEPIVQVGCEIDFSESDVFKAIKQILNRNRELLEFDDRHIRKLTALVISNISRISKSFHKNLEVILINEDDDSVSSIMKDRIRDSFPWFKIIDVLRPIDFEHDQPISAGLIISTCELDTPHEIPQLLVTPLVTEEDIQLIQCWVSENAIQLISNLPENKNQRLVDLLKDENIIIHDSVDSWQQVVFLSGKNLIEQGSINPNYLIEIINNTKKYGPYSVIAPGIALLHARPNDGVNNLCLSLLILKNGVDFEGSNFNPVNVIFLLGMFGAQTQTKLLNELILLIRKKGICEMLIRCKTIEEVKNVIRSELNM
jgi:mannitol/fructose-specific phosphotransferase system IIA component (Ntr-type)